MATSCKFDPSSSSLDRPLYTAQHGSNIAASLDRPGSFRECTENPNQKSNRHVDYKRHVNAALGISPDESPSSSAKGKLIPCPVPEDVKHMRDSLYLSTVKKRERVKMFNEALSVFNVKKRSRVEGFSSDRSSVMLLIDNLVKGTSDDDEEESVALHPCYPWEGSDRDYEYEELLGRVFNILRENNVELAGDRPRTVMRPPQVLHEGTKKTVFVNFIDMCKTYQFFYPQHFPVVNVLLPDLSGCIDSKTMLWLS
ncbi:hypothetical protein TSUD_140500 [Trifolium subterraneum]|uniref:Translation initiation factor IF2/IF5 domain-containing protein n=1 Tax=Trifolium subterraneum TaxID=3900 RepID=A0A2Z6NK36_TRISU|nr:hypothetical protein TSUD_140500 [Trifolium subterraneum]